ncbi:MAG: 16S rRNA (cytosine(967)-C(5))-methyltransferase RsmB [Rhodocyclaceae bacterium]|jgi:16S rRNA (cytosine967-C5)-methyltransferase|nr:16S rRNA (cytosine(967)-C(5))-methyltransferase RsmB [Rhodocyclaceae bacterium]MCL4680398.1 16S rRNA (cytosine(967)-C(5))-methyltransferase RsmB [Rhodocyclaceae bacterium]
MPLEDTSLAFALHGAALAVAEVMAGRNLNEALAELWRRWPNLPPGQRGAVQDLAYGALRRFGRDDFHLARLMQKPPAAPVRALLLVALARLAVRPEEAHTVVDQAVEAAGALQRGKFKALVNGVLRNFLRRRAELEAAAGEDEAARWQHPRWWIARLRREHPGEWQSILEAGNGRPPMTLRVNRRRVAETDFLARLLAADIEARPLEGGAIRLARPLPVERLSGFAEGLCSVQDAGAQRAAALLDVHDGQRVLDACAAPGGKTAHILERAAVELLALDADAGRAVRVSENLLRLGLTARVAVADCRETAAWWDGRAFDRILADVPCSASGVVRRHPDIKWLRRASDIARFARAQAEILDALWRVLAPGGKLLYATCSLFAEENERQVAAFAARQEDCMRLPVAGAPGLQLLPNEEHDGFFYALLEKQA